MTFIALFTVISIVVTSDLASANPLVMHPLVTSLLVVFILVVNLPVNGLMLLCLSSVSFRRGKSHRPMWRGDFRVIILGSSLLLSAVGVLVDMSALVFYRGLSAVLGALVVLGSVGAWISWRYLEFDLEWTVLGAFTVVVVNILGWALTLGMMAGVLIVVFEISLWILFIWFLLHESKALHSDRPPFKYRTPEEVERYYLDPAADTGPTPHDYKVARQLVIEVSVLWAVALSCTMGLFMILNS